MTKIDLMSAVVHALAGLMDELLDDEDIRADALEIDLRDGSATLKNIAAQDDDLHGNV